MKRDELPALTGVRFYAAVLVYLNHLVFLPGGGFLRGQTLFVLGGLGVTFFFVLSGFILAYNYEPTFRTSIPGMAYRLFLWDRFSKIYPTYLLTLLLALPVSMKSPTLPLDWAAVPVQLALIQCWLPFALPPYYAYLNSVGWSISCEALFYLTTPLLIAGFTRVRPAWIGWLAAATASLIVYAGLLRLLPPGNPAAELYFGERFALVRLADFAIGTCLGVALSRSGPIREPWAGIVQGVGLLWLAAAVFFGPGLPWWCRGALLTTPGIVLLILGLVRQRGCLVRHLSHPWIRRLGVTSFGFYLFHHLILRYLKAALMASAIEPSPPVLLAIAGATLLATCGLAYLVYARFELPVQQQLRRWIRRHPTRQPRR